MRLDVCWATAFSLGTILTFGCSDVPRTTGTARNVAVVVIDTLRADRLGLYGYPSAISPSIDRLAEEAVVFERAHAPAPWTLPSVVSLMLSKPACEHGIIADGRKINESARPLAERLLQAGFATGAYTRNPYAGRRSGLDRGFETSEIVEDSIDEALVGTWLEANQERPFFLYVHMIAPHNPAGARERHLRALGHTVPKATVEEVRELFHEYRILSRADFAAGRSPGATDNSAEQALILARLSELREPVGQLYDAQVLADDERVGRIVEELRARGVWEETLFILLSDHGEEMGEHGGWLHDQSAYEELMRVPLLVKLPHGSFGGHRIEQPVSLLDVMPTILDAVGREDLAADSQGESLLRRIEGGVTSTSRVTGLRHNVKKFFRPFKEGRGDINVVIVDGRWKGIYNVELGSLELYDLAEDPAEERDLSGDEPQRTRSMLREAHVYYRECVARQESAVVDESMSSTEEQMLRSLGYIE